MMISLRLNEDDSRLVKEYAALKGVSISEFLRQSALERIDEEVDLRAYDRAMAVYKADPVTYSLDEVERELGL